MHPPTSQPWCKICGLTLEADVVAAINAGADALGFNFFPRSARYLAPEKAATLCRVAREIGPSVERIGLFVNAPSDQVKDVMRGVDLSMLQFHGDESIAYCEQFDLPYIKVVGVTKTTDFPALQADFASAWALLLDTHDPVQRGGTGRPFDWSLWPDKSRGKLVLAGGLDPSNVAEALQLTQAFGVDVAGGVEGSIKGVKDHDKLQTFIEAAKHG